jgi:hypothetical protein
MQKRSAAMKEELWRRQVDEGTMDGMELGFVDPHPLYSWAAASVAYREATRTRDE